MAIPEQACVPDGSRRGGQGADEVGHGVWNVDGQGRDVGLHGLHRRLGCLLLLPLLAGQRSERDLDVCAREPERAPEKERASVPVAGLGYGVPTPAGHRAHLHQMLMRLVCWEGAPEKPTSRYEQLNERNHKPGIYDFKTPVNKNFRPAK